MWKSCTHSTEEIRDSWDSYVWYHTPSHADLLINGYVRPCKCVRIEARIRLEEIKRKHEHLYHPSLLSPEKEEFLKPVKKKQRK